MRKLKRTVVVVGPGEKCSTNLERRKGYRMMKFVLLIIGMLLD